MPTHSDITIRKATSADVQAMVDIYNHYVVDTIISFEETPIAAEDLTQRLRNVLESDLPWLVAERNGQLLGYAYATKWKERHAYRFSVEVTAYVAPGMARQGIGSQLYDHLLPALKHKNIHAAMGGISLPNEASIALHEKHGFKKVAHFKEVGYKFDRWIDVGYWQLVLSQEY